jgi:energy-converting hydrogenase Eha subunit A
LLVFPHEYPNRHREISAKFKNEERTMHATMKDRESKSSPAKLAAAARSALALVAVCELLVSIRPAHAQTEAPAVVHNTWTSGAAMPTALLASPVGVLKGQIYVVGGYAGGTTYATTQIYNPATNTWTTGVSLPTPTSNGGAAVVENILYVIGGSPATGPYSTNAVWAYSPKTKTWTEKAAMPTPRYNLGVVVEKNIIYAIGGIGGVNNGNSVLNVVESYNPATDTWTEENPLLIDKEASSVGLIKTTIVAAGGYNNGDTEDNEGYDATTNAWSSLTSDPEAHSFACAGSIGTQLFATGGWNGASSALSTTESFKLSKNTWKSLAPIPQATIAAGSAVLKGKLYCFGGWASWGGATLNNVQIYQP